jgi:hypothetical protein
MTLRVDQITASAGTGNIVIPANTRFVGTDPGTFDGPPRVGGIVQMVTANAMPISHLSVASTGEIAAPLTASITPKYATSKIRVESWSTMQYGASASPMCLLLYRDIGGAGYNVLTPLTGAASRYTYGWSYIQSNWNSAVHTYIDTPNTTSTVTYRVNYRNWSGSGTNYFTHQYMEYGWTLTEIYA